MDLIGRDLELHFLYMYAGFLTLGRWISWLA